jgi:hypothetical protein
MEHFCDVYLCHDLVDKPVEEVFLILLLYNQGGTRDGVYLEIVVRAILLRFLFEQFVLPLIFHLLFLVDPVVLQYHFQYLRQCYNRHFHYHYQFCLSLEFSVRL